MSKIGDIGLVFYVGIHDVDVLLCIRVHTSRVFIVLLVWVKVQTTLVQRLDARLVTSIPVAHTLSLRLFTSELILNLDFDLSIFG